MLVAVRQVLVYCGSFPINTAHRLEDLRIYFPTQALLARLDEAVDCGPDTWTTAGAESQRLHTVMIIGAVTCVALPERKPALRLSNEAE